MDKAQYLGVSCALCQLPVTSLYQSAGVIGIWKSIYYGLGLPPNSKIKIYNLIYIMI